MYWKNQTVLSANYEGEMTFWDAANGISDRGICQGDFIYGVTVFHGKLFLINALQVAKIYDRSTWARKLGIPIEKLWDGQEFAVAQKSTRYNFHRQVPLDVTRQLRFCSHRETIELMFIDREREHLDVQTLRGRRELTAQSAELLNGILEGFEELTEERIIREW